MRQVKSISELRIERGFHYCATPYSKYPFGLEAAYTMANDVSEALNSMGIPHFMPIVWSHEIALQTGLDQRDHVFWLSADRPYMEKAASLVIVGMLGWEESIGIIAERSYFGAAGKPIFIVDPALILYGHRPRACA